MTAEGSEFVEAGSRVALEALDELHDVFVFVKDRERRFVYFNRPFATLMGLSAEQILHRRDEDLSPEHLADHYRKDDETVLKTGERLVGMTELVHNADGSYDWFTTTKFPVRSATGATIGVAGVTRSLTKRNTAADQLLPLEPAIKLMSEQYHRPLSLRELAQSVAMSPTHFARVFKSQFGTSPLRYLRRVRHIAACELLSTTNLPIGTIAAQAGYYDHSHFTNDFVRRKRLTPTQYRQRYRRPPPRGHVVPA